MTIAMSAGLPAVGAARGTPGMPGTPGNGEGARGGGEPFSACVFGRVTRGAGVEAREGSGLDLSEAAGDGAVFAR